MSKRKVFALTTGEPAGIGPDLALSLREMDIPKDVAIAVIGDGEVLAQRAKMLGKSFDYPSWDPKAADSAKAGIFHVEVKAKAPVEAGKLNTANAPHVIGILDRAIEGVESGEFSAIVTAPLHKGVINDYGMRFTGHTEYFQERAGVSKVVMMLAGEAMKVALVTTHYPLKEVASLITRDLIKEIVHIIDRDFKEKFAIPSPRILVVGLNPHAGEGGHLGTEEIEIIEPALEDLKKEGVDAMGPYPADTIFQPFMLEKGDVVLCMYHDQGLPVLKYATFGHGVNVTLGLPYVRTSVDHGTALDLAGKGKCMTGSLEYAIKVADMMTRA